jgi:hypothetical protein
MPLSRHTVAIRRPQLMSNGRAFDPLSPPMMTQEMPSSTGASSSVTSSSMGSSERNFTVAAGARTRSTARRTLGFTPTVVPNHTFFGTPPSFHVTGSRSAMFSGRFVSRR